MIRRCPTCPIRFNDESVPTCPKCSPQSGTPSAVHAVMSDRCASCGFQFENGPKWWESHGNYCQQCVRDRLNARAAARKTPQRRVARGRHEQAYVALYDKFPTTLELAQFVRGARARRLEAEEGGEDQ